VKVIVSASGKGLDAQVDPRFGRAPYFLLVDTETMEHEALENRQNLQAPQGAGIQAATLVARQKPAAVLTGHCGPKAFKTLQAANIQVAVGVAGSITEVIERFRRGEYSYTDTPDVEGHWV
jgi:predicted Fe-Mo cluster-binding NifX family protein